MVEPYDASKLEPEIQEYWTTNKIYDQAKAQNKGKQSFYFLDGPPYTSGRIHLGQAWNKSLKDMVLRFKRMSGFDVWDRAGYDMHGLPTAHKVQDKYQLTDKNDIEKFGIAKFMRECKKLAQDNLQLMNQDFRRLGVWMDFDNAYQSVTNEFMEGEWWLVKKAHDNKRLYEGEKSMHWCGHCGTALAKHELEYKNKKDTSIFLKFKIKNKKNEFLLVWTTTPWTIPFNLGVMVNPDVDYVRAEVEGEIWCIAKALVTIFVTSILGKKFRVKEEVKGQTLEGIAYEHPLQDDLKDVFDPIQKQANKAFTVLLSKEYVDTSSGTGLVHTAPGCGPEDYEVGQRNGIPPLNKLNEHGVYDKTMGSFAGWSALTDNDKFIEALKVKGCLLASTPVDHEYAHCWRCKKPVVFKTTKQWFFKVEDLREKMRKENKKISWSPEWAGTKWFDSWLENLRDNGITRQRYWGTPLPIWKCKKCKAITVIGSRQELKNVASHVPKDLHKPAIDEVTIPCTCGSLQSRIPDILDVWIDSGSTSWTCLDYPQKEKFFNKLWPADFILEGKDQIRGWFNLLLVASMVSMQKPSFKSVFMHGFVQDAKGRKMSKSLGNVISPYEVIDRLGADTLRYYMIGGSQPGIDINYNDEDLATKNKNLGVLWNLHNYLIDLVQHAGVDISTLKLKEKNFGLEEAYILSKLNSTIQKIDACYEKYQLNEIPSAVEELYLELSRTYIQLIRDKVTSGSNEEKEVVIATLYYSFFEILKLLAPIIPMMAEKMYLNLKEAFKLKGNSLHLHPWPKVIDSYINLKLELAFSDATNIIQGMLSARDKMQKGIRWPLQEAILIINDEKVASSVQQLEDMIKIQTNVKELKFAKSLPGLTLKVKPDFKQIGPDFGKNANLIVAKLVLKSPESIVDHLQKEGKYPLTVDNATFNIVKEHLIVERTVPEPYTEAETRSGFVYLNKETSPALEAEGFSRELMRRIQNLRKKSALQKTDSVSLAIEMDQDMVDQLSPYATPILEKVGASEIDFETETPTQKYQTHTEEKIKGRTFGIYLSKSN